MFKVIFVLVINVYHGGLTTIDFTTRQQCEAAKTQVKMTQIGNSTIDAVCIEKQVPLKKTKCKIVNENYRIPRPGTYSGGGALENFPYPVALECVEE